MKCPKCKTEIPVSDMAKEMGSRGGASRSPAKLKSLAENRKKGGRPKGSKNKVKWIHKGLPAGTIHYPGGKPGAEK